jgi:hypothetical protein
MNDMLHTKVKNVHSKELLDLEKDFHANLEKMREHVNNTVSGEY